MKRIDRNFDLGGKRKTRKTDRTREHPETKRSGVLVSFVPWKMHVANESTKTTHKRMKTHLVVVPFMP